MGNASEESSRNGNSGLVELHDGCNVKGGMIKLKTQLTKGYSVCLRVEEGLGLDDGGGRCQLEVFLLVCSRKERSVALQCEQGSLGGG